MKRTLVIASAFAVASFASAQLTIDVTGVPGSGVTNWVFGGSDTANNTGTIRDTTNNTFSAHDTGQFPFGQDTIANTSYQNIVFALTGTATVTVGADTEAIAGIFLDDDGASADDLGLRVNTPLAYAVGEASSLAGSGTVNVDINDFFPGVWSINGTDGQAMWFADEVIVTFTAVPEPATMIALGAGFVGLLARRRRK